LKEEAIAVLPSKLNSENKPRQTGIRAVNGTTTLHGSLNGDSTPVRAQSTYPKPIKRQPCPNKKAGEAEGLKAQGTPSPYLHLRSPAVAGPNDSPIGIEAIGSVSVKVPASIHFFQPGYLRARTYAGQGNITGLRRCNRQFN